MQSDSQINAADSTGWVIRAEGLGKAYPIHDSPRERLMHALFPRRKATAKAYWALRGVALEVRQGESVGIIGRNGSGKSTLLQLITGTLAPSEGSVAVSGKVGALLELGAGFDPGLTGRQNVFLNGLLSGHHKEAITEALEDIVAFAELGEFFDQPIKEYSSGMVVRLAFAIQTAFVPDVLIVDEALSVGDFFFQQKCLRRIRELRAQGTTLLFVSHDMGVVRDLCDRVLYLRHGELVFEGETHVGIRHYLNGNTGAKLAQQATSAQIAPLAVDGVQEELESYLSRAAWAAPDPNAPGTRILCVVVEDVSGRPGLTACIGDKLKFSVVYRVAESAAPVHVAIVLKNRYDQIVNCTSTYTLAIEVPVFEAGDLAVMEIETSMLLEAGQYTFLANLGLVGDQPNRGENIDETPWLGPISIVWAFETEPAPFLGMFGLPALAQAPRALCYSRN